MGNNLDKCYSIFRQRNRETDEERNKIGLALISRLYIILRSRSLKNSHKVDDYCAEDSLEAKSLVLDFEIIAAALIPGKSTILLRVRIPPLFPDVPPIFSIRPLSNRTVINNTYFLYPLPDGTFEVKLFSSNQFKVLGNIEELIQELFSRLRKDFPYAKGGSESYTIPLKFDKRYNDPSTSFPFNALAIHSTEQDTSINLTSIKTISDLLIDVATLQSVDYLLKNNLDKMSELKLNCLSKKENENKEIERIIEELKSMIQSASISSSIKADSSVLVWALTGANPSLMKVIERENRALSLSKTSNFIEEAIFYDNTMDIKEQLELLEIIYSQEFENKLEIKILN